MMQDFLPTNGAERVVAGWAIVVTCLMVLGWVAHFSGRSRRDRAPAPLA
jgi:hypothetical protein